MSLRREEASMLDSTVCMVLCKAHGNPFPTALSYKDDANSVPKFMPKYMHVLDNSDASLNVFLFKVILVCLQGCAWKAQGP